MDNRKDNVDMKIDQLSPHLFWDVEREKIHFLKNKKWLLHRVLEYGLLSDWILIYKYYGIKEIANTALQMRNLDKKTISFISALSKIPKEKFLCYTTKPLSPEHWNF